MEDVDPLEKPRIPFARRVAGFESPRSHPELLMHRPFSAPDSYKRSPEVHARPSQPRPAMWGIPDRVGGGRGTWWFRLKCSQKLRISNLLLLGLFQNKHEQTCTCKMCERDAVDASRMRIYVHVLMRKYVDVRRERNTRPTSSCLFIINRPCKTVRISAADGATRRPCDSHVRMRLTGQEDTWPSKGGGSTKHTTAGICRHPSSNSAEPWAGRGHPHLV